MNFHNFHIHCGNGPSAAIYDTWEACERTVAFVAWQCRNGQSKPKGAYATVLHHGMHMPTGIHHDPISGREHLMRLDK